jgi:hypothetical protein
MKTNSAALLLMLLSVAPCLGQCTLTCADCGGADAVCCNGTPTCDCAATGCSDPNQVCDDGCCVVPSYPSEVDACSPRGECDSEDCFNGCCACPCAPDDGACRCGQVDPSWSPYLPSMYCQCLVNYLPTHPDYDCTRSKGVSGVVHGLSRLL